MAAFDLDGVVCLRVSRDFLSGVTTCVSFFEAASGFAGEVLLLITTVTSSELVIVSSVNLRAAGLTSPFALLLLDFLEVLLVCERILNGLRGWLASPLFALLVDFVRAAISLSEWSCTECFFDIMIKPLNKFGTGHFDLHFHDKIADGPIERRGSCEEGMIGRRV